MIYINYNEYNIYLRDNESVGYTKMMKSTVTGFQLPFKILETFPKALRFVHHIENEIPRMRAWRIKTQLSLEQCLLKNYNNFNIPRVFEPTLVEIHFPFFVRYINWTLDKVQSSRNNRVLLRGGIEMNWEFWLSLVGIGSRWLLSEVLDN
uniref:Uncharacterized protein n=1 Tax=Lactuca sativa TaxID=4236 RepID=A0A9R1XXU6_LACSA|nr:hypothetical protein LSAT_V11C100043030 [Lactuca sativa]